MTGTCLYKASLCAVGILRKVYSNLPLKVIQETWINIGLILNPSPFLYTQFKGHLLIINQVLLPCKWSLTGLPQGYLTPNPYCKRMGTPSEAEDTGWKASNLI